ESYCLATVGPGDLHRSPYLVTQVARGLEGQFTDTRERHPCIATFGDDLQTGPETGIGITDPLERYTVDCPAHRVRLLECLLAQCGSLAVVPFSVELERLHHHGQPLVRLADDHRCTATLQHLGTLHLAGKRHVVGAH